MTTFTTQDRQDAQRTPLTAKQRYDKAMEGCNEPDAIERLRFFCSLAMTGQDWIDVEPFFDAIKQVPLTNAKVFELAQPFCDEENLVANEIGFARAIERAHGIGE